MTDKLRDAIAQQISEGLGATLRKFCDSPEAKQARHYLHAMPNSDWNTLIGMLAEESAGAARAALAAAPQPAPEEGLTRAQVGAMLDAKRNDREALVEAINQAQVTWDPDATSSTQHIAAALLARGLRLPGGEETMAWAVVGEDGEVIPGSIYPTRDEAERVCDYEGERVVRVAIRVVEGGDDAA